ncbi:hypothetical protein GQ600_22796 [Phytophthora cactorum]|nr:hypothetical protein GQ600_22796 [Phytophthora cactorum]
MYANNVATWTRSCRRCSATR